MEAEKTANNTATNDSGVSANASASATDDAYVNKKASDIAESRIKEEKAQKAIAVMENLNKRYNEDPSFRDEFDRIWKNEKAAEGKDDASDLDPIEELRRELAEAKSEVAQLRNMYGYDKLSDRREGINRRYENDFKRLASEFGYDPGSDAYEDMYAGVLREGRTLARKFGLVAQDGSPDPLKEYTPEFLKEAFNIVAERHKRSGFLDAYQRNKERDARKVEPKDEVSKYFDAEKLKTPEARARALERAFKHKFPNLKIV